MGTLGPMTPEASLDPYAVEGYGYQTTGGAGGTTYHVTSLGGGYSGSGTGGTFAWCVDRAGPAIIVFDVGGEIVLDSTAWLRSDMTVDGTTAPSPGITIRPPVSNAQALGLENVDNVIIKGLRFTGYGYSDDGDLLGIDGDPDGCSNVVVSHCTFSEASDGALDIATNVTDVTVQWCLFHDNDLTQLIKYGVNRRISIHHCAYANCYERNPLMWGDLSDCDWRNNIVYGWTQSGLGIDHGLLGENPDARVNVNVVNNLFTPTGGSATAAAIIYVEFGTPAANGSGDQGDVVTTSNMGELWVSGNILPSANTDDWSTVSSERTVPAAAAVTTVAASSLKAVVLPYVGTSPRTAGEQTLIDTINGA